MILTARGKKPPGSVYKGKFILRVSKGKMEVNSVVTDYE
jgi:hypothetical protein